METTTGNVIDLTAAEIEALLEKAGTALQAQDLLPLEKSIGTLDQLSTTAKDDLVSAINELFTSAGNGKAAVAAAITGMGVSTAQTDSWATMAAKIGQIKTGLERLVANDTAITPTGSYANGTYYNVAFGVKVGYCPNGDVLISMKSGTTTAYENLNFTLASAPAGVTITASSSSWDTANPAGQLYVCVLSGITKRVNIAVSMSAYNASYDYTTCAITVTAA